MVSRMPGGTTINTAGRMHVQADETVYLQPWSGTVVIGGGGGPGTVDAQDFYIRAAGKWASQLGSDSGTICGWTTGTSSGSPMGSLCKGLNPYWSCPAGYFSQTWDISFGDGRLSFCTKS